MAAGACWRKGSRSLGVGLQQVRDLLALGVAGVRGPRGSFRLGCLAAQGVVLLMYSKKNHRLTDCS